MYGMERRLKPRLERRNAMKNIKYHVDEDEDDGDDDEVYSFQFQNETSLRVQGNDGEFDHILRSLGLSGPDDFAIPTAAWEQSQKQKQKQKPPSPSSNIHIQTNEVNFNLNTISSDQSKIFGGGGIKGVRPPPVLAAPPLVADQVNYTWDLMMRTRRLSHDVDSPIGERERDRDHPLSDSVSSTSYDDHESEIDIIGGASAAMVDDVDEEESSSSIHNVVSPNGSFTRWTFCSWQKGEILGKGSFGTVYEGFTNDGIFFAVKEVSLLDDGSQGKQSIFQLQQEISLLSQFQHENIVQYFGTDKDSDKLYIFLELVTKGSLASLYQKYRLRDSQVSSYTRQILSGLKYLHDRNVVHRDIKCANILVDANGSVKLADFGLAKATKLNDVKSSKGSPYWMAPEVVNMRNRGYGLAADIWSLGCTVLEMLTRQPPYSHLEGMQALFRIGRGQPPTVPESLSKDARDFILKCLQVYPNKRPTAAQLLDHPFVKRPLLSPKSPASPSINFLLS